MVHEGPGSDTLSAMDDIFNVDPVTRSEASESRSSRRRRRDEESRLDIDGYVAIDFSTD